MSCTVLFAWNSFNFLLGAIFQWTFRDKCGSTWDQIVAEPGIFHIAVCITFDSEKKSLNIS